LHEEGFPYLDVISREFYLGWRSRLEFDFDQIIVAEVDGRIVGKIEVYPWFGLSDARKGFVDGFIVNSAYRGKGIGTQLLLEAEKRASKRGITQLDLGAKPFAKSAIHLYKKLGYKKLNKVYFLKVLKRNIQVTGLLNDIYVRPADPARDAEKLFKTRTNTNWYQYPTQEALETDIKTHMDNYLVLEHAGEVEAYIKYNLADVVRIFSLGIRLKATLPTVTLLGNMLARILVKALSQEVIYIEVDENNKDLLKALRSLGFEIYETEFHMRKLV